ncbi:O-antigen polymerase [Sphingobacterium sp. HJSM2_6]|uniref:O-antigen polymerase n=1 Tax=Sphingobacterium sp. HJSM2_6 TaxID=3366264 RepID=UPI003BE592B1
MDFEILYITFNCLIYLVSFIFLLKNRGFDATSYIFLLWAISSFFSILYFNSSIYFITKSSITLFPFLYIFVCYLVFNLPLLNFKSNSIIKIYGNPIILKSLIYVTAITSILPFIENLLHIFLSGNTMNLSDNYEDRSNSDFDARAHMSFIGSKLNSITLFLNHISPILLFYFLSKVKKWDFFIVLITIGLIFSTFNPSLFKFNLGSRTSSIQDLFYIGFVYLIFKNQLSISVRRFALIFISILVFVLLLGVFLITVGRFEDSDFSLIEWLYRYSGESFTNFNGDLWNSKKTLNGLNSFSNIFSGEDRNVFSLDQKMGIRMFVFYTFIGDLVADFGLIITFLIILFFSLVLINRFSNNYLPIWKILIICLYARIILTGFTFLYIINGGQYYIFSLMLGMVLWYNDRKIKIKNEK